MIPPAEKARGREPVHTSLPYGDFESSKSKQPNAPCFADTLFNCFGCGGDDSFRFSYASISPKVSSDDFYQELPFDINFIRSFVS